MESELFNWTTVRKVARRLDVSQQYVSRLIAQRRIRAVHTELGYFVDPVSVEAFHAEREARRQTAC